MASVARKSMKDYLTKKERKKEKEKEKNRTSLTHTHTYVSFKTLGIVYVFDK